MVCDFFTNFAPIFGKRSIRVLHSLLYIGVSCSGRRVSVLPKESNNQKSKQVQAVRLLSEYTDAVRRPVQQIQP